MLQINIVYKSFHKNQKSKSKDYKTMTFHPKLQTEKKVMSSFNNYLWQAIKATNFIHNINAIHSHRNKTLLFFHFAINLSYLCFLEFKVNNIYENIKLLFHRYSWTEYQEVGGQKYTTNVVVY